MDRQSANEENAHRLCLSCGLCCNGAIFNHVVIESADDVSHASKFAHFDVVHEGRGFMLPCSAHHGGKCGIYEDRPTVCRSYRCMQLDGLIKGETTFEAASAIVETAVARREQILKDAASLDLPLALNKITFNYLHSLLGRLRDCGDPDRREKIAGLALQVARLKFFLAEHFSPHSKISEIMSGGRGP